MTTSEGELYSDELREIRGRDWWLGRLRQCLYTAVCLGGFTVVVLSQQGKSHLGVVSGILLLMTGALLWVGETLPIPAGGLPDPKALQRRLGFVDGYTDEEVGDIVRYIGRLLAQTAVIAAAVFASVQYLVVTEGLPVWTHAVNGVTLLAAIAAWKRRWSRRRLLLRS